MNSERLALPDVTLIAATSINVAATVRALETSMQGIDFGAVKLLTDRRPVDLPAGIVHESVAAIGSAKAYSQFVLRSLADHVATSHCLLIQWDGHVVDARRWRGEFLSYDYIGASWPQFAAPRNVGNGGFSLRSRTLLQACQSPHFEALHPEDVAICRHNRDRLEAAGIRFAPERVADLFAAERSGDIAASFGYHGVWHMPRVIGREAFWTVYRDLDERTSVAHDLRSLVWQMAAGKAGMRRAFAMIRDHHRARPKRSRTI